MFPQVRDSRFSAHRIRAKYMCLVIATRAVGSAGLNFALGVDRSCFLGRDVGTCMFDCWRISLVQVRFVAGAFMKSRKTPSPLCLLQRQGRLGCFAWQQQAMGSIVSQPAQSLAQQSHKKGESENPHFYCCFSDELINRILLVRERMWNKKGYGCGGCTRTVPPAFCRENHMIRLTEQFKHCSVYDMDPLRKR